MININRLRVRKKGRTICCVSQLQIAPGERVAIVGPNGSGKTTFLRVLSELEKGYDGDCRVDALRKDRVYVHQSPYLFRGTVLFNITYGLCQRGTGRAECERLAGHWLDRFGLRELAGNRVNHLSGGERRRVALARAMILQPQLLLLDEPLADMDKDGAAAVALALDDLKESTILIASPVALSDGLTSRIHAIQSP